MDEVVAELVQAECDHRLPLYARNLCRIAREHLERLRDSQRTGRRTGRIVHGACRGCDDPELLHTCGAWNDRA